MVLPPRFGGPAILLFHAQSNFMFLCAAARGGALAPEGGYSKTIDEEEY
jgi:hypothetical protein